VIDVPDVELDPFGPRQRVAAADLCVACDARADLETAALCGVVVHHLLWQRRARTDQTHVPDEHVPQLGKLVQAGRAQQSADRGRAFRVGLARVRRRAHSAELRDRERHPVATCTGLSEQHGSALLHPDGDRDGEQERRADDETEPGDQDIGGASHRSIPRERATAA
jgi:hypothetical protein